MKEELVFYEHQRFKQWWFIALMICINGLFICGCIIQIGFGKSWGNNPMNNTMLIVVTVSLVLFTLSFFFMRLNTIINEDGIYVRLFPFQLRFKFRPWDYISDVVVVKINLTSMMGGRGVNYGFSESSYIMSGNRVMKLTLKNNKKIYIGTQRPEELSEFLEKLDAKRKQK